MKVKVKAFDEFTSDTTKQCNDFLEQLNDKGLKVLDITSFYNTILGGIIYVVTYECLGANIKS